MNTLFLALTLLSFSPLDWTVGYSERMDVVPEKFVEATVPGAAQLDIAKSLNYPDYTFSDNYKMFSWMEDVCFTYRSEFAAPKFARDERVWFCSKGIDYSFEVRLNGKTLLVQEGMFTPVNIDITEHLKKYNVIEVVVDKAPKHHNNSEDRTQAAYCAKPPVSYGWDWHPRLIPSGIWDETGLQIRNRSHIASHELKYTLNDDFSSVSIIVSADVTEAKGCTLSWKLFDREGGLAVEASAKAGETLKTTLDNPKLWWCHDLGDPYLYSYRLDLKDAKGRTVHSASGNAGFRRIRLVPNEGTLTEMNDFPKSRNNAPAQFELNGRRIFAKGTNWLCPDIFIGRLNEETYDTLLNLALKANFNSLRCWGGCAVDKDSFFELCDRKGILVWQEFPLACNDYPDDEHYLSVLEKEAESIVRKVHPHPCLALLCGGNELYNSWSGMDEQSLPLRLLNAVCLRLSPEIPFNPTSPLNGMGHGCYLFRYNGDNVFNWMSNGHFTAYTEFGMPGASPREVLEKIIPADQLFPARPGGAWEAHHAFYAWDAENTWLDEPTLTEYFGEAKTLDELIANSQLLQSEGYRFIYEEARRQKPYCAMAMNWSFNEPWPSAANNSLVVWPAVEKPSLSAVSEACRPVCPSAKFSKFRWEGGEMLELGLWMLNDSYQSAGSRYEVKAVLVAPDGAQTDIASWSTPELSANDNIRGPQAEIKLPEWDGANKFCVRLCVAGYPEMDTCYTMAYRK